MPTPLLSQAPRASKRASSSRALIKRPSYAIKNAQPISCAHCNMLPMGSVEVAAILLVLVFSLAAVLFTSMYATQVQTAKVEVLEAQLANK